MKQKKTTTTLTRQPATLALLIVNLVLVGAFLFTVPADAQGQNRSKRPPTPPPDYNAAKPTPGTPPANGSKAAAKQRTATGDVTGDGATGTTNSGRNQRSAGTSKVAGGERTEGSATGGTAPKPTGKNLSDKQKTNVSELVTDLQDIKSGSTVTQGQIDALAASLTTLAQGTTKPDPAAVDKLAADLADVVSDGGLSNSDLKLLSQDITNVLNSANVPQSEVDAVIANAQAILVASGVNKGDALEVQADLQEIAKELKKNVSNAAQTLPTASPSGARRRKP